MHSLYFFFFISDIPRLILDMGWSFGVLSPCFVVICFPMPRLFFSSDIGPLVFRAYVLLSFGSPCFVHFFRGLGPLVFQVFSGCLFSGIFEFSLLVVCCVQLPLPLLRSYILPCNPPPPPVLYLLR